MPVCPACGQDNPEGFRLCGMCGTPLVPGRRREMRKIVTALFCDVAGYTKMGDRLDPEALRRLQSGYFDQARAALERHGAAVEKFIGDAIMAVFGIPQLHEDDALRAVRAAVEVRDGVAALGLEARIGVNTGEVVAGTGEALVTGDAVNVAARLEQAAQPGEVLLGEATFELVRDAVEVARLEALELKGKDGRHRAYRLLRVRPGASGVTRRLDSPLVGRVRELRLLTDAFERVVEERACQLFSLLGSAGVGKSRLAEEFLAGVRDQATVVRGRCLPYGDGITFWPLVEALDGVDGTTVLAVEPDARSITERLEGILGLAEPSAATAEESFWAVRRLFEALSRERPLVTLFDDIHWAKPTFLDLVEHVADWSRDAPIMLLCLARPELLDARRGWGGDKFNATTVLLEPLGEEESKQLLEHLVGHGQFPDEVRARITDAAEGNPLFVEQLLGMLIDEGMLERRNGGWVAMADLSSLRVPPTIQAILASRLDRLEAAERAVIERAAVEGKVFHRGAVSELSPPELRPEVATYLLTLVRRDLIRPDRSTVAGEDAFRFRHLLVRDAAYEAVPKETRAQLHERFAAWLEAAAGTVEYEEIVGYHLERAFRYRQELGQIGPHEVQLANRAAHLYAAGGRRARVRGDISGAVSLFRRAVALLPGDHPEGAELLLDLGAVLLPAGEIAGADAAFSDARARADALGDRRLVFRADLEHGALRIQLDPEGRSKELLGVAERAIPVFEELGDERGLATAWKAIADVHHMASRMGPRAEALERALTHARRGRDELGVNRMLGALAVSLAFGPTAVAPGIERLDELRRESRGLMLVEGGCDINSAALEAMRGRFEDARRLFSKAQAISDEVGAVLFVRGISGQYAWLIETLAGDDRAAERAIRASCDYLDEIGEKGWFSTFVAHLGESLYRLGRLDEAAEASRASEQAGASDDVMTQALWRQLRAKVLARRGDLHNGESLAREAVGIVDQTDSLLWRGDARMDLAEVLRLAGRPADADTVVLEAIALYEQKGATAAVERARAQLAG